MAKVRQGSVAWWLGFTSDPEPRSQQPAPYNSSVEDWDYDSTPPSDSGWSPEMNAAYQRMYEQIQGHKVPPRICESMALRCIIGWLIDGTLKGVTE